MKKWQQNFEQHWQEKFGEPYVPKKMAEPLKKEQETETLEEKIERVYSCDPGEEDLKKAYGEDFDKWCDELLKDI